ncbi:MAG: glycosyltransferase [Anaerolineales bacterium]|nr:glycosyltransferase [Anaerolineales bacterium]
MKIMHDSISGLKNSWAQFILRIERLPSNLGFAIANNIGSRLARGKWLVLLNADAFPEPDWLE